jgi:hypothetical protein
MDSAMSYARFAASPLKPGMFVQFGRGLTDREIVERLVMSYSEHLDGPVHFVPPVRLLAAVDTWPSRGVMP